MPKNNQYYVTESEISRLFSQSGLPSSFTFQFTKDYASVKRIIDSNETDLEQIRSHVDILDQRTSQNETNISTINTQITSITAQITGIETRLGNVEVDLDQLMDDFDDHVNASQAHGSTGDIVGTNDFCSIAVGGTVLQATPLSLSTVSTISVTSTPNAAPAAYSQADAATWVAMLNEIKSDFNSHITEYNILLNKLNAIITTQVSAKQRSP